MRSTPFTVSVIVPVRDGQSYLGAALESISRQTLPAAEILVIDDGSRDESPQIAHGFGSPVRCVSTPPRGPAAARNFGVSLARGDLLAFLDADDQWSRTKLERQHAGLAADPTLEAVFGRVSFFRSPDLTPNEARHLAIPTGVRSGWLIGAMLIRRAAFLRVGRLAETLRVGDFVDWAHRARGLGLRTYELPDVVLHRRVHARNLSRVGQGDRRDLLRVARAAIQRQPIRGDGAAGGRQPAG